MRVIAGALKGQRLTTPKGRTTRPTADQVRIACLDTLMPYLGAGPFLKLFPDRRRQPNGLENGGTGFGTAARAPTTMNSTRSAASSRKSVR